MLGFLEYISDDIEEIACSLAEIEERRNNKLGGEWEYEDSK